MERLRFILTCRWMIRPEDTDLPQITDDHLRRDVGLRPKPHRPDAWRTLS